MSRLEVARQQFEQDWHALRRSVKREVGTEPRWSTNLIWPVLALAAGVLVGANLWRRRARRK